MSFPGFILVRFSYFYSFMFYLLPDIIYCTFYYCIFIYVSTFIAPVLISAIFLWLDWCNICLPLPSVPSLINSTYSYLLNLSSHHLHYITFKFKSMKKLPAELWFKIKLINLVNYVHCNPNSSWTFLGLVSYYDLIPFFQINILFLLPQVTPTFWISSMSLLNSASDHLCIESLL